MIFYALVWMTIGIALAALMHHTYWIFIVPGCLVVCMMIMLFTTLRTGAYLLNTCFLLVGMLYFEGRYYVLTNHPLPIAMIKTPMLVQGVVRDIPHQEPHSTQFLFSLKQPEKRLIRITWYDPHPLVLGGDRWRFTISLKPSWGLHNFGAFDYQQWLIFHGISATGNVLSNDPNTLLKRGESSALLHFRERLLRIIQRSITDPDCLGLITALTVGSQVLIEPEQWPVFQRTSTNHLMAIAGLHMGVVAGFGFILMGVIGRFSPRILLYLPLQSLQALAAMVSALLYGAMSGLSLPTQRAVVMIVILMCSLLIRRNIFFWYRFVIAFCLVVFYDPFSFFSVSLWMSFGSVFFIAYVNNARLKSYKKWHSWWRLQLALCIGLMPLTLAAFHQVSVIGVLANAFAVPWVAFLILPLCLLAAIASCICMPCAIFLFHLSGLLMKPLWQYLSFLSQQSWGIWAHVIHAPWVIGLGVLGILLLLLPRGIPGRYFGIYFCLPLFLYQSPSPAAHEIYLTVLDVGQGLSLLIETQHHALVYDAGPKSYGGFDSGESIVVPYLHYEGISRLDTLMISHGDNDHIGGADAVLRDIPTHEIMTSVPQKFKTALACYRGQHWTWDGIDFDVLWPLENTPYADNNSSCVLRITNGHVQILLTGDIEKSTEQWLADHEEDRLASDILVAPHHGSGSSSTQSFIDLIKPKRVIISSGYYNRYHFPAKTVVTRYEKTGATVYNTATDGAVFMRLNNNMIETVKFATLGSVLVCSPDCKKHWI